MTPTGLSRKWCSHTSELSHGDLSTLFYTGLRPSDRHWNISSPGWTKHAWSCFFTPWNAEATVFIYRISPFEIESVLVEHAAVAEAAVVPSLDDIRHSVPKAFVVLAPGHEPTRELAAGILAYCASRLAPYKRVRRIEFAELPKTVSGKIRRVQLRELERERRMRGERSPFEFFEQELVAGEHRGNS